MGSFNTGFFIKTFWLTLSGIPTTMLITTVSLIIAVPFGFMMALSNIHKIPVLRQFAALYISFIQGTPAVVLILFVYSLLPSLLAILFRSLGVGFNVFGINTIVYACIIFSLNTAAVLSEVFRSALETVDKGQMEAASAMGLTTAQAYRRIIIPQALVVAMPNLCNSTVNLIKSTSLVFMMGVRDITAIAKIEASFGYHFIESYLDIWIVYIILCSLIEAIFKQVEKKLSAYGGSQNNRKGRMGKCWLCKT